MYLVSVAPKAKLQQVMMTIAQRVPLELIAIDAPANGFVETTEIAALLADAVASIAGLDRSRLLLFGGWESASHGTGATMQIVAERLGLVDQFQGVDELTFRTTVRCGFSNALRVGCIRCPSLRAPLPCSDGRRKSPEPANNPQVGMQNMRAIMPALQKAKAAEVGCSSIGYQKVALPSVQRETRIVKDQPADEIARELVEWLRS